jgi:3D (Asp-Asp-Asp) domain-containing protein
MKKIIIFLLIAVIPFQVKNFFVYTPRVEPPKPLDHRIKVSLTTYTIDPEQTDSTPLETASGFIVDSLNPRRHKIIAISWDLKRKFKFGSKVKVENAGRLNGVYVVRDLMNKRFKNKIDILINPGDKNTMLRSVLISKI